MSLLDLDALTVRRGQCPVVDGVSLTIEPGECVGLIGPNGAGKTTLMRAALGLQRHAGRSSLTELPASARARAAAWLPQAREIAWPVTVETLVALGRLPHAFLERTRHPDALETGLGHGRIEHPLLRRHRPGQHHRQKRDPHDIAPISSRPTSIRLISLVPAPIS